MAATVKTPLERYLDGEETGLEDFLDSAELKHFTTLLMFRGLTRKTSGIDEELSVMLREANERKEHKVDKIAMPRSKNEDHAVGRDAMVKYLQSLP